MHVLCFAGGHWVEAVCKLILAAGAYLSSFFHLSYSPLFSYLFVSPQLAL